MADAIGLTELVQPTNTQQPRQVPSFSAYNPEEEFRKWKLLNPIGNDVNYPTWQQAQQERGQEMAQGVGQQQEIERRAAPTYVSDLLNTSAGLSPSEGAAVYNKFIEDGPLEVPAAFTGFAGDLAGSMVDAFRSKKDHAFGTVGRQIGETLPRASLAAWAGGLPGIAADAGLQHFGETGSPLEAAKTAGLVAATGGAAKLGGAAGERFVADRLARMLEAPATTADATLNRGVANEMLAGIRPKLGRAVGATTAATGAQVGGQLIQGQDPTTAQNVASTLGNAAMMGGMETTGLLGSPSAINLRGRQRFVEWVNEQSGKYFTSRGLKGPVEDPVSPEPFQRLLSESLSETDSNPAKWRRSMVVNGLNGVRQAATPEERQAQLQRLSTALVRSNGIGAIADEASRYVEMAQINPPTSIVDFADLVKRVNLFKATVMTQMDEKASEPGSTVPSWAGFDSLEKGGFVKNPITLDWLKEKYGANIERTLGNSDQKAYLLLVNQVINELSTVAELGKQARSEAMTKQSIAAGPQADPKAEQRAQAFLDALAKISPEAKSSQPVREGDTVGEQSLVEALYDRFNHHEEQDTKGFYGTANNFMEQVTAIVTKAIEAGQDPATIDWTQKVPVSQTRRVVDPTTKKESETQIDEPTSLQDYIMRNEKGDYLKKVYGRPEGVNQKLVYSGDLTSAEDLTERQARRTAEVTETPNENWDVKAQELRGHIDTMTPELAWDRILAPALGTGRALNTSFVEKHRPDAKDIIMAILEGGPKTEKGHEEKRQLGEAGMRLLAKWPEDSATTPFAKWSHLFNKIFGSTSRDPWEVRNKVIKYLNDEAQKPQGALLGLNPLDVKLHTALGRGEPTQGASLGESADADLYRTVRYALGNLGYSPDEIASRSRIIQQVFLNLHDPNTKFAPVDESPSTTRHGVGFYYPSRNMITLLGKSYIAGRQKETEGFHLATVVLHELVHNLEYEYDQRWTTSRGVYDKERFEAYRQLLRVAELYTPQERYGILKVVSQIMIPEQYRDDAFDGNLRYGAGLNNALQPVNTPVKEFVNVLSQVLGMGMITGGQGRQVWTENELFEQLPDEAALFAKGLARDMNDLLEGVKSATIMSPFIKKQIEHLTPLMRKMVLSLEPAKSFAQADEIVTALEGRNWSGPMPFYPYQGTPTFPHVDMNRVGPARDAIQATNDEFFGDEPPSAAQIGAGLPSPQGPKKIDIPAYWKYVGLSQQALDYMSRRGFGELANDLGAGMRGYIQTQNRLSMGLWAPFLGPKGKLDPSNPIVASIADKSIQGRRDNQLRNDLLEWQQSNEQPAIEQVNGQWQFTAAAGPSFANKQLNPRVAGQLLAMREVAALTGTAIVDSRAESVAFRVARLIMEVEAASGVKTPWDLAYNSSMNIVQGLLYQSPQNVTTGMAPFQVKTQASVIGLMNGGLLKRLQDLQAQMATRQDWFATERREGRYVIMSQDSQGVAHADGAVNLFDMRRKRTELEAKGWTVTDTIDKSDPANATGFGAPDSVLERFIMVEQKAWNDYLTTNLQGLTAAQLQTLRDFEPGMAAEAEAEKKGLSRFLLKRKRTPFGLDNDYVDMMRDYIFNLTGAIARTQLHNRTKLILADGRLEGQRDLKQFMDNTFNQMLTPTGSVERSAKAFSSGMLLAANLSSGIVNAFDVVNTLPETLIQQGGGFNQVKHVKNAIADFTHFMLEDPKFVDQLYQQAKRKRALGQSLRTDEIKAYAYKETIASHVIDKGLMEDIFGQDQDLRTQMAKAFGTRGELKLTDSLSSSAAYRAVRLILWIPRMTHQINNEIMFFAGLNQAIERGDPVDKAIQHGDKIRSLGGFAGGKSNMPGYMGHTGRAVPVVRTMHTLQQYTYGVLGRYVVNARDSISDDPHLTQQQKTAARKAFGTLLMSNLALAGLLGLPAVAGVMTLVEKLFGIPAEEYTRRGLKSMLDYLGGGEESDEFARTLTETAMNGVPNQLMGVTIGNRIGMANSFGLSTYDGFNLMDLAGPAPSVVGNMVTGLGYLAQGEPQKAATSLAPAFLKRAVDAGFNKWKYGDTQIRDPQGVPLFQPDGPRFAAYLGGFNPSGLTERQRARQLIGKSNARFNEKQARERDSAAVALREGNTQLAWQWAMDQVQQNPEQVLRDPMVVQGYMKSLVNKAASLSATPDPLASGPVGNAQNAQAIAGTFPSPAVPRTSAVDELMTRMQIGVPNGVPTTVPESGQMTRAMMVDAMIQQSGGKMTRPQAEQMVQLLGL